MTLCVGDVVLAGPKQERGTVVWIQPEGWMQTWSRADAAGGWLLKLSEVCLADLRELGVEKGRWLKRHKSCDHDKPRAIIRLEQRTTRRYQGIPPGSVRYDWRRVDKLQLATPQGEGGEVETA